MKVVIIGGSLGGLGVANVLTRMGATVKVFEMLSMGFADDVERIFGASPCLELVSRHRRASSPSEKALGGLFFDFGPVRTGLTPRR